MQVPAAAPRREPDDLEPARRGAEPPFRAVPPELTVGRFFARARELERRGSPEWEARFHEYALRVTRPTFQGILWLCLFFIVAFWPTDPWIFEGRPEAVRRFATWRLQFLILGGTAAFVLPRLHSLRGLQRAGGAVYLVLTALSAYHVAQVDLHDTPWLHVSFLAPTFTIVFLVPLALRVLFVAAVTAVTVASYLVSDPVHLHHPHVREWLVVLLMGSTFTTMVGAAFYLLHRENHERQRALERMATTDALTGVSNRWSFFEEAARALERLRRYADPFAVLYLDLDEFKRVNDRYGHEAGDLVLRHVPRVLATVLRRVDRVGRLGGEELAVLLPTTDLPAAIAVAERVREAAERSPVVFRGESIHFTLSVGCAEARPDDADVEAVLRRADRALYEAKRLGRNRVASEHEVQAA